MTRSAPLLWLLLVAGFALRLTIAIRLPNMHWGDEIFQVTEPAHRLVFGTGIVTWEWLAGIRSWLLPGVFAALMAIGRALGETDPALINLPGMVLMAALGCVPISCGYGWGRQFYGTSGALIAGVAATVWSDLLYMSPHTLGEVIAADLLPLALYLGLSSRLFGAGLLLGLTFALRFHLAPALLVAAIAICGRRGASWRQLATAAALPVLVLGLLDWATLGRPFQSIWLNAWYNMVEGVSQEYGTDPWWMLFVMVAIIWLPVLPVLLPALYGGGRRLPPVALVAATIFATHAAIAHKEYRFIYPSIPLVIILAGLGTAAITRWCASRLPGRAAMTATTAVAVLAWLGMSAAIATRPYMNPAWTREAGYFAAYAEIAKLPGICSVATNHSVASPGNTWLPPLVRLYQTNLVAIDPVRFTRAADAFNAIAASSLVTIRDPRFHRLGCHDGNVDASGGVHLRICVWVRAGGCDASAAPPPEPYWPDYFRRRFGWPPFDWAPIFTEAGP